ncbi:MAG: DUF1572 family protein [Gemmatimonadetes bacterium]|nr:DUF1572 family protein [Gemmatimonadota bacterium]
MLRDLIDEYRRYRVIGERALAQIPDDGLNHISAPDGNSPAMIVRHLSGNLSSRFTDFLSSDGEKPWRDRDQEFAERTYTRAEVDAMWARGWRVVDDALGELADADLARSVTIRGEAWSVHAALCRSVAHAAYHVGQLVTLARQSATAPWQELSIPRGSSAAFYGAPFLERGPV